MSCSNKVHCVRKIFKRSISGLRSGLRVRKEMIEIAFRCRKSTISRVRWDLVLLSINTVFVAKAWLSR